jgi:hypothetical protein
MSKPEKAGKSKPKPVELTAEEGETKAETMARVMVAPYLRHGLVGSDLASKTVGDLPGKPQFDDFGRALKVQVEKVQQGELAVASELLTTQALTMDAMATELLRRAAMNLGDYPRAAERYARLAFKAQSNSKAALDSLTKLHQPRVQTVRHVHVNQGGQAVVADNFHQYTGGRENGKWNKQPHATGATGKSAALLGTDAEGKGVPVSSCEGEEAVQDARRQRQRRAKGKS